VIGAQEVADGTIALQNQAGEKLGSVSLEDLVRRLSEEVASHRTPELGALARA
jgi:threonyl-tRNA synthetase